MKAFTSINQFRNVVATVRNYYTRIGKPLPTLRFAGRPKLHGTNAGIRRPVKNGRLRPQSRNNILSIESDNAGFARYVESNYDAIEALFAKTFPNGEDVTVFGEWCGRNIQDKVALVDCPKHFVVFGAWDHSKDEDSHEYVPLLDTVSFIDHSASVYHITEVDPIILDIDFANPHLVQDALAMLVEQYEERCPWAYQMFGVEGIGEGLVWTCEDRPFDSELWFKTKGDKHAKSAKASKVRIVADPEKLESIKALVERVLPAWRLEQGLTEVASQGVEINTQATAAYLKWVCNDVLKEESDTIEASGFDWKKDLSGPVVQAVRQYYFAHLNKEVGL